MSREERTAVVVERLAEALRLDSGASILALYGPGTGDSFVCLDYQERNLKPALWQLLRAAGFDRVVFGSVGEPLHFLDAESRDMSLTGRLARRTAAPGENRMRRLTGPQGPRMQLAPSAPPRGLTRETRSGGTITAPYAVQTLHSYMTQPGVRTALVIERAEDFFRHVGAIRELADRLGMWVQDGVGGNVCILVFSAATMDGVVQALRDQGSATALADYLSRQGGSTGAAGRVPEPGPAELSRLVHLLRIRHGLVIDDWTESAKLIGLMSAGEPQSARTWLNRLSKVRHLNRRTLSAWVTGEPDDRTALEELSELTGLAKVKELVNRLRSLAQVQAVRQGMGVPPTDRSNHLVFTGNPGTGKTTVARIIGRLYREAGLLARGHVVEVDTGDLVGEYVGHTPAKTREVVDRALDGVLFLDEAYRLTEDDRGGFNRESLDIILTRMENDRDRLVVIAAGYTHKMTEFISANPGLRRRFPAQNEIEFPDYEPGELLEIVLGMLTAMRHTVDPSLKDLLKRVVTGLYLGRDPATFGNAGEMRNLAQALDEHWAERIVRTAGPAGLRAAMNRPMMPEDVPASYREAAR
ncbi:AAA family ATPase [Nonomuraea sp. NPDC050790]|uniref:AAA family ATPase n=1 Tax=Nonomuraea sp. NPDC050790 TaxID=3364371 RepID=UPI00379DD0F7